jgi:hypothetical protein
MAEITYVLNQETPENIPGFEQYQDSDKYLIPSYQINSLFDSTKNYVQLHIVDFADNLLSSKYNFRQYSLSLNAASAGKEGASVLTLDPIKDSLYYGYSTGGIKLLYHFLSDLYTDTFETLEFYIDSISADRTELSLLTYKLTPEEIVKYTEAIKTKLKTQSYFSEFRLDLKDNNLLIGVNIDTLDTVNGKSVVVKLYEPLPENFKVKNTLNIVESISDSVAYEIDYQVEDVAEPTTVLRSPNFNIDVQDHSVVPSQYFTYDDLLGYQVGNTNSEVYSMINEKGVELSVDYSDYNSFIHFSSAQERLINFKYKVDLLTSYSASLSTTSTVIGGAQGVSGSTTYYQGLYQGIINNFDHYERFLYYESGSYSWPKSNSTKPYINIPSKDPVTQTANATVTAWYTNALTNAVAYDSSNYNALTETVPTYLRDDANNEKYLTFVYMVGQHFDNLWIYGKAVTDKYNNDNRINYGISKDLVGEALKNFGVKLYTSNKSIEDLFTTFIGQAYQSGSEKINHYITGSLTGSNTPIQPTSYDDYQKQVQKRIYHNLPLLLKSKGTERGLRALINCLGIPSDILKIKLYGGRNTNERPFFGDYDYYTGSLDKIRLDNTGSIVPGNTLSNNTSIIKRDDKYTDDLHIVEVGFAPVDNVNNYIKSQITGSFDIDDYIGDPSSQYEHTYSDLNSIARTVLSGSLGTSGSYDLRDYVKLIKFYDNTIFKMVKDFIPARALADTGIIIKPNLINRSKARSVIASGSRPEYSGSIDTAFIVGGNAGIFNGTESGSVVEYNTAYTDQIQTPTGPVGNSSLHGQQQPRFNGEFQGSGITVTYGNLTSNNPYLVDTNVTHSYDITFVTSSVEVCLLNITNTIYYVTSPTATYNISNFFNQAGQCTFQLTSPTTQPITFPVTFGNITPAIPQYSIVTIQATNPNYIGICQQSTSFVYGICNLNLNNSAPNSVIKYQSGGVTNDVYNIESWFSTGPADTNTLQYIASWNDGTPHTVTITRGTAVGQSQQYYFDQAVNTAVTITVKDSQLGEECTLSNTVVVNRTGLSALPTGSQYGNQFVYSLQVSVPAGTPYDPDATTNQYPGGVDGNGNPTTTTPSPGTDYTCAYLYRYIGPPGSPYLSGTATLYSTLGVPGYFAPLNAPDHSVGLGPITRYSAYQLSCYNANERNTTNWKGNWHIKQVDRFDNVSPYSIYDSYTQWDDFDNQPNSRKNFLKQGEKHYTQPGTSTPGTGPYQFFYDQTSQAPYAITFTTDVDKGCECTIPLDKQGVGNNICINPELATYDLIRAYVIRAYENGSPLTFAQTTVYGNAHRLARLSTGETLPLEGVFEYPQPNTPSIGVDGLNAKFINLWLLTNWDYSVGHPTLVDYGQPNIYTAPPDTSQYPAQQDPNLPVGPWIQVPVRYFYNPDPTTASPYFPTEKAAIKYVIGHDWGNNIPGF